VRRNTTIERGIFGNGIAFPLPAACNSARWSSIVLVVLIAISIREKIAWRV